MSERSESGTSAEVEAGPLLALPEHRADHRASSHVRRRPRGRLHARMHHNPATALATKIGVTVVGSLVLLAGIIMLVTPGPGLVGIAVGLAILSTEYDWAARWLQVARRKLAEAKEHAEQMDPAVRRRRIMLIGAVLVVVACFGVWYVVTFDWPRLAVDGWGWAQSIAGWLPDLPGM
ncbi:MAG: PGPGW domain-containing protein [Nocardioides sp.]|nr:PGPGW domain-containing protein [Nocardioides sp.]